MTEKLAGMFPSIFPHLTSTSNLYIDDVRCGGEFGATFRAIPALVAQGIELRFPKPCAQVRILPRAPAFYTVILSCIFCRRAWR